MAQATVECGQRCYIDQEGAKKLFANYAVLRGMCSAKTSQFKDFGVLKLHDGICSPCTWFECFALFLLSYHTFMIHAQKHAHVHAHVVSFAN